MTHIPINQAALVALINQVVGVVVGFGILSSSQQGVVLTAASSAVSAAFMIANAVHHVAATKS